MLSAVSLLIATIGFLQLCSGHDWNYQNTEWPGICTTGKEQSPINLSPSVSSSKDFPKFIFKNYTTSLPGIITNNGHSITVQFQNSKATVEGGGLPEEYTLDHFHFHWGSEHTIKGKRFPLEMHLVHYATRLKNVSTAVQFKNGLAVLGVLFQLSPEDDDELNELNEAMESVLYKYHSTSTTRKLAPNSFVPRDTAGFYRYQGSLTTPGCNEGVIWTVFTNTIPISQHQVDLFQKYESGDGQLTENYRPVQALNGRTVHLKESPIGSGQVNIAPSLIVSVAALLFLLL